MCCPEKKPGDRGKLARASLNYAVVISHNLEIKSGEKLLLGSKKSYVVASESIIEKPILKYKAKSSCLPHFRSVAMNPVEHPFGGGNHQHHEKRCPLLGTKWAPLMPTVLDNYMEPSCTKESNRTQELI
ncbi:hypothetical protein A6R68_00342, partial [Neotoma lepida]